MRDSECSLRGKSVVYLLDVPDKNEWDGSRHRLPTMSAARRNVNFAGSHTMPSSSIAQILLRLFALNWLLTGLVQVASVAFTFGQSHFSLFYLAPGVVYFVAGLGVWMISPKLTRFLVRPNDGEFNLNGVTEQQLYAAVFLGLGLYFTLTSFGGAFGWMHFLVVNESLSDGFDKTKRPSYYDMSETMMTLAAGLFLAFSCKTWARKLARKLPSC